MFLLFCDGTQGFVWASSAVPLDYSPRVTLWWITRFCLPTSIWNGEKDYDVQMAEDELEERWAEEKKTIKD